MFWNNHYFLLQAFDLLGRKLYPDSWAGNEYESRDVPSPEELLELRTPIEQEIAKQERLWDEARTEIKIKLLSPEDQTRCEQRIDEARNRCIELQEQLLHIEKPTKSHERAYKGFRRLVFVRDKLYKSFQNNEIQPLFDGTTHIDWDSWLRNNGCKVFLAISVMTTNRMMSGKRRGSVTVEKVPFDKWLRRIEPLEGYVSPDREAQIEFDNVIIQMAQSGVKTHTRDECIEIGVRQHGLSANLAKKIWQKETPPEWRRKGRPRKNG